MVSFLIAAAIVFGLALLLLPDLRLLATGFPPRRTRHVVPAMR